MRRPWIKIETCTPDKPEICFLATTLRMDPDTVVGKLVRLWSWMELNRVPANDLGVTKGFLDKLVGRKGFADALAGAGWLVEKEDKLGLHNMERHNGGGAKIRAMTAQRVALHRQRKLIKNDISVTKTLQKPLKPAADDPSDDLNPSEVNNEITKDEALEKSEQKTKSETSISNDYITPKSKLDRTSDEARPMAEMEKEMPVSTKLEPELTAESLPKKRKARNSEEDPDQPSLF